MTVRILIDGYNLIRNVASLAREEQTEFTRGRQRLLEWLAAYRRVHPGPVSVVFDGGKGGGYQEEHDLYRGIRITFSPRGQTADDIIKKMVSDRPEQTLVVSSDQELAGFCRARGAGVIGSREFAERIQTRLEVGESPDDEEDPPAVTGPRKKKGLSHRPSKKKKREMKYWGKV